MRPSEAKCLDQLMVSDRVATRREWCVPCTSRATVRYMLLRRGQKEPRMRLGITALCPN
jgi:hypothetical protein